MKGITGKTLGSKQNAQNSIFALDQKRVLHDRQGPLKYSISRTGSATPAPNVEIECNPRYGKQLGCMFVQKEKRKYTKRSHEVTQQTVENASRNVFVACTIEIEERIKNILYQCVETMLTAMPEKGILDEVFEHCSDRRMQSALFMNSIPRRALIAFCYT